MLRGRERESKKWKQIWLDGVIDGKLKNGIKKVRTKKLFTQKKKSLLNRTFIPTKSFLPSDVELSIANMPREM